MTTENKKIGQKIKKARLSMNLTQSQLGKTIGVTGSSIGYLEAGLRKISPDVLKKISNNLNKPFKYFYEENSEKYDLFSKIMELKKQLDSVVTSVEKVEKEKFGLKVFYENIVEHINKVVFFLDENLKVVFLNKKAKSFLEKDEKKGIFKEIIKQFDKEIKGSDLFKVKIKKISFTAKSVYDKTGLYLGVWFCEE